jgi:hypothetical protein
MEPPERIFTPKILAALAFVWFVGTTIASLYPGLLVFQVSVGFLALAMLAAAWRNKTVLFAGTFPLTRGEALLASVGAVLFVSFASSGFVILLLKE